MIDADSISQNLTQWVKLKCIKDQITLTDNGFRLPYPHFRWKINMDGVEGTLYEGEHFQLLFKFNNKYPFDSPGN